MKYLSLKEFGGENGVYYEVQFESRTIGKFIMDVDGYFYFEFIKDKQGLWSDYILLELGNKLKDVNKEWNDEVSKII